MSEAMETVDIEACAREPIHIPGSIQPHGTLIAWNEADDRVVYAAANTDAVFGVAAADLLGARLADALPIVAEVLGEDARARISERPDRLCRLRVPGMGADVACDLIAHRSEGLVVLEAETVVAEDGPAIDAIFSAFEGFVVRLQRSEGAEDLAAITAAEIRAATGFDRVLVYHFDDEWHGTVVAEDGNGRLPSLLDHRFPASDIPAQARQLYLRNRLRIIPDGSYQPVPIMADAEAGGRPLDLSLSTLRSVSPVHVEYMRNMGTGSSMSISILREGSLWGLISCHSAGPHAVPFRVRSACDVVARIFALQLAARERAAEAERQRDLAGVVTRLLEAMIGDNRSLASLGERADLLLRLTDSEGAAIVTGDACLTFGDCPSEPMVRQIAGWLMEHDERPEVFSTDRLDALFPASQEMIAEAAGVLAVSVSKRHQDFILWFRPEIVQTVKWGGPPDKPVHSDGGELRLHPRHSFETWRETVRGRSRPWRQSEIEAVGELRNALVGIVLARAEELAAAVQELKRTNKELESFSYSVSHDLRAPFRHIVGYSELLKEYEGDRLDERGRRYVDTIIESAITAGHLVDNLLEFAQMGRKALSLRMVDMTTLAQEVRGQLGQEIGTRTITWKIDDMPKAWADLTMMRLVLENLIGNAVKYTGRASDARIELGAEAVDGFTEYFVRDNGVGFDMKYVAKLFGVFQRLHRAEEFEGTGIGLANVKRIVERHGGYVRAEGALNRGATIVFALPLSPTETS